MTVVVQPPFVRESQALNNAIEWAGAQHARQRRDADRAPFILHPLEVAALLSGRGYDESVVLAGVLHDIVEQTDATVEDIRERFGERVASIVAAVSEDDTIADFSERKAALRDQVGRSGPDALAVYAADKIVKARELRSQAARTHALLDDPGLARRMEHYEHSLLMLRQIEGGTPFVEQLAFELWALRALPPGD